MEQWRQRKGKDSWHFCGNCSNFPTTGDFRIVYKKPTTGEGCDQCIAKERAGTCTQYVDPQ